MANEPIKFKKVFNPTGEDLHFTWDSAPYVVKAGESETFIDYIADMGARVLADKNVKTSNPDEHRVLFKAYLENSDPHVVAQILGINLDKIRAEVLTKEKEKAKITNLEAQVAEMRKQIEEISSKKIEDIVKERNEDILKEPKVDRRTKEFKASQAQEAKEAEK